MSRPPAILAIATVAAEWSLKPSPLSATFGASASPTPIAIRPAPEARVKARTSGGVPRVRGFQAMKGFRVAKRIGQAGSYWPRDFGLGAAAPLWATAGLVALALAFADPVSGRSWPPDPYPAADRVDAARALAESAPGTVSFAVVDGAAGVRGYDEDNAFSSASSSKAILLAAELRRLRDVKAPLDDATRSLLDPMITYSDNDAAAAVYARVGDARMTDVAQRAGMRSFSVDPGYWGGAQVTAADFGRFYFGLDRNLVGPHDAYAKRLLAGITDGQRWGIPEGAGHRWDVYFKGGWRPPDTEETTGPVTHQAGLLEHDSGRRVAIAVLTDLAPGSTSYAVIEGITERLLERRPPPRSWPAP